jgi:hypothetical protein
MSLVGLVNLAERLLNQGSTQGQDAPVTQNGSASNGANSAGAGVEDLFTPSGQNSGGANAAQDAGLFTAPRTSVFTAAANLLLGRNAPPAQPATATSPTGASGNGVESTTATNAASASGSPAPAPALGANDTIRPIIAAGPLAGAGANGANGSNNSSGSANGTATSPGSVANASSSANASAANASTSTASSVLASETQLQSLNNSLAALGLTAQQIDQIDQIASIINDFNPDFFTALAYQLQAAAQAKQGAAPATAASTTDAAVPGAASSAKSAVTSAT